MFDTDERLCAQLRSEYWDNHATLRAQERYGLEVNPFLLRTLEQMVRQGRVGVALVTDRHLECEVLLLGQRVRFAYRIDEGRIVTFLPLYDSPVFPREARPIRTHHKREGLRRWRKARKKINVNS